MYIDGAGKKLKPGAGEAVVKRGGSTGRDGADFTCKKALSNVCTAETRQRHVGYVRGR